MFSCAKFGVVDIEIDSCAAASVMSQRGPSSLSGDPPKANGRKNTFHMASKQRILYSGCKGVSGKASGCSWRLGTRFRWAPVHRVLMRVSETDGRPGHARCVCETGGQATTRIEVVGTGEQIKDTEATHIFVMDLALDGGKKSACFRRLGQTKMSIHSSARSSVVSC